MLNDRADSSRQYLDLATPTSTLPLNYMGPLVDDIGIGAEEICELWLGPCGCQIYHIHQRDDTRWDSIAGEIQSGVEPIRAEPISQ